MDIMNITPIINSESNKNVDLRDNVSIISDEYRATYDRTDSFENSRAIETDNKQMEQTNTNITINIYRYKFTDDFTVELFKFSKIHQYDERKAFKEAWNIWIEDNEDIVNEEYKRLKLLGYDGDIFDKMFKSARYYFRKKSTEKKEPAQRRIYVGSQKDLLESMDEHIKLNINTGNFKPSEGFDEFCKQNVNLLKEEISVLCRAGLTDSNEIKSKIKKTYKNRYFIAIRK